MRDCNCYSVQSWGDVFIVSEPELYIDFKTVFLYDYLRDKDSSENWRIDKDLSENFSNTSLTVALSILILHLAFHYYI